MAYDGDKYVAHITITRFLHIHDEAYKTEFWLDGGKPRPFVFFAGVEPEYKGRGIAAELICFANKHYKDAQGTPLYSGTCNSDTAVRVWEKLVDAGLAFETEYAGKRRWGLY